MSFVTSWSLAKCKRQSSRDSADVFWGWVNGEIAQGVASDGVSSRSATALSLERIGVWEPLDGILLGQLRLALHWWKH